MVAVTDEIIFGNVYELYIFLLCKNCWSKPITTLERLLYGKTYVFKIIYSHAKKNSGLPGTKKNL